jgi:hypothetical protein
MQDKHQRDERVDSIFIFSSDGDKQDYMLDMWNVEQKKKIIKLPTINKFGEKCEILYRGT